MKYIPELDGLRALSVLGVLFFHLKVVGFSLGWVGVNFFFVISGFLITRILLDAKAKPYYFRNFYARRALRIFPIYYLSLALVAVIAAIAGQSLGDGWAYLFYLQNFLLGFGNWQVNFPAIFNHTWSLAIEEQFYLLWPVVVYLLSGRQLKLACVLLFVGAFISRAALYFWTGNPNLQFTLLPTQLDALAAGALLAVFASEDAPALKSIVYWSRAAMLVSGIGLIVLVMYTGYSSYWEPGGWADTKPNLALFSLLALFFAGVIAHVSFSNGRLSAFLRLPWLTGIGKISYGIYVYHYLIFGMMAFVLGESGLDDKNNLPLTVFVAILKLGLTLFVAQISWRWFESPILVMKERFVG